MNLIEDICTDLYRSNILTQSFRTHQFIIYSIFRPSQVAIAETFCSGLLQCWVDGAGGFHAYPAGRSVASARKVSYGEWVNYEAVTRQTSLLEERMEVMKERADLWRKALNWQVTDDNERIVKKLPNQVEDIEDTMDES